MRRLRHPLVFVGVAAPFLALGLAAAILIFGGDKVERPQVYPTQVLDLRHWALTLPTDGDDKNRKADEVRPTSKPISDAWFHVTDDAAGVVFRAPVNGVASKHEKNARTELRHDAEWSNHRGGAHTMTLDAAITATPRRFPSVVCARVDDDDGDVILVKLRDKRLYVTADDGKFNRMLDADYVLGTKFHLSIRATKGVIRVTYDDAPPVTYRATRDSMHFAAGVYNQSNLKQHPRESPTSYGEVVIYDLKVSHPA